MTLEMDRQILQQIQAHGEAAYPEEGAGLLLGEVQGQARRVRAIYGLDNTREQEARHNRYLVSTQDYVRGEQEADRLGLEVLGVFHSHPDHPSQPSEYDREWAMPWFSYVITSVEKGKASNTRSWLLIEDRSRFEQETINIVVEINVSSG